MRRETRLALFALLYPALHITVVVMLIPLGGRYGAVSLKLIDALFFGKWAEYDGFGLTVSIVFMLVPLAALLLAALAQFVALRLARLTRGWHICVLALVTLALGANAAAVAGWLSSVDTGAWYQPPWIIVPLLFALGANYLFGLKQIAARPDHA